MTTAVPLVVPRPLASRHLLPYTCSCPPEVEVKRWLVPPWQSHSCGCVPFAVLEPGTSMQRPEPVPTIVTFDREGGWLLDEDGLDGGGLDGEVPPNWVKNFQTSGLTQLLAPLSQPAQPST